MHEKSLLLALVPASILFDHDPQFSIWFQILGVHSMYPLLLKDGLVTPYFLVTIMYYFICIMKLNDQNKTIGTTLEYGNSDLKMIFIVLSVSGK